jgi:hypothetical protein
MTEGKQSLEDYLDMHGYPSGLSEEDFKEFLRIENEELNKQSNL